MSMKLDKRMTEQRLQHERDQLLRKGLTAQGSHTGVRFPLPNAPSETDSMRLHEIAAKRAPHSIGGASAHPRTEFGTTTTVEHGALMISIDEAGGSLSIHGTNVLLSEIDRDLREAAVSTAAAFNAAFSAELQAVSVTTIGLIVSEILRRDSQLSDRIREIKTRERYD